MPTDTRPANTRLFDDIVDQTGRSPSAVRKGAKELNINVRDLDIDSVQSLIDHFKPACKGCGLHFGLHPDTTLCPSGYTTTKGTIMSESTETTTPARKRQGSTTRSAERAAKPATSGLTAAQVARDNSLDARKFRAFLRGAGIDRTFANKTAVNKAIKAFAKSQS